MRTDAAYELLRQFASPVVAVTSAWQGRTNGMILDSAQRASISPHVRRLTVQVHKWHMSHDLIWNSGALCVHLLHQGQLELVHRLGFRSGRDGDKLADVPHRLGRLGLPILGDRIAAFELRVINTMDVGYATVFLGDVEAVHPGREGQVLTPSWLRANMPPEWEPEWLANYRNAQDAIDSHPQIEDRRWTGPRTA